MGFQSKTWSLSDEVVAEIERRVQVMKARTGSGSPNRVLLEALAGSYNASKQTTLDLPNPSGAFPGIAPVAGDFDPRSIPGVSVGLPEKKTALQFSCVCKHNAPHPDGREFESENRNSTLCPSCFLDGHRGEARDCRECALGDGTGAI